MECEMLKGNETGPVGQDNATDSFWGRSKAELKFDSFI